jgi:hypothetical protein
MMTERYVLLDPTGISLPLVPTTPIDLGAGALTSSSTTVTGGRVTGAAEALYELTFDCMLSQDEWNRLDSLARWQQTAGRETELVLYYLFDKHSDYGPQTRESVPDLPITSENGTISYYPVIQGDIEATGTIAGRGNSGPHYRVTFTFLEGTIRRP